MAEQRVVFSQTVEGLARALGPLLDVRARARFKALGIDFDRLDPGVPLEVWTGAVTLAAELIAPGELPAEQLYRCGRRFIEGYGQTMVGKALLAMIRLIGPRRTLARMHRNFRSGNSYTEATLHEVVPGTFELWVNPVRFVEWYRGLLEAGLEVAGATRAKVEVHSREGEAVTFRIGWS